MDVSGLKQQASAGTVTADTLVWKQGMSEWTAPRGIAELKSIVAK